MPSNAGTNDRVPTLADMASRDDDEDEADMRLRIVRTATESLHESNREDIRRAVGKRKRARKGTIKERTAEFFGSGGLRKKSSSTKGSKGPVGALAVMASGLAGVPMPSTTPGGLSTQLGAEEQKAKAEKFASPEESGRRKKAAPPLSSRRVVHVNSRLPECDLDSNGEPKARYARNKVRTSKYTLWSFLPKNVAEQFRRAANGFFLVLVVLQVFPIFGAAAPQVAMLPLLAVLTITAVKDGIEDWRRHRLDNEVNNSAVTRLGRWRNVNIPKENIPFFRRLFGLGSIQASKGVRKLREKEGSYSTDFLYSSTTQLNKSQSMGDLSRDSIEYTESLAHTDTSSHGDALGPNVPGGRPRSNTHASSFLAPSFRSTAGRSGVVDYSRSVPGTASWERTLWKKLEVGDMVLLKDGDQVPADIAVLSTSDPEGICFVETKNLDGETNLKPRRSLKATASIQSEEDAEHSRFAIDAEPPHANLYSFNGVLRYLAHDIRPTMASPVLGASASGADVLKEAVTINELLLRGCALRNTAWVIGLVIYTGADTKIMLNQGDTPSKRSKIEKETNYNVLANFVILVLMCLTCAVADSLYVSQSQSSASLFEPEMEIAGSPVLDGVVTFAACLILFQTIVPISLVITVELVKTIQAFFIYLDIDMYYEPLDHPCVPKSWNISDDLGQIEYIFSDKTGTLTQNVMELQKCSVAGIPYGEGITEAMLGAAKREGRDASALDPAQNEAQLAQAKASMMMKLDRLFKNRWLQPEKLTLIAPKLADDLSDQQPDQRSRIRDLFRAVALCHTALAELTEHGQVIYKAESPDEAALVSAARDVGFVFLSRTANSLEVEIMGQIERWIPLRVLEFNSTRKRMSVIVRAPDGRIMLICKGADSVIYQRLRSDHDAGLKEATLKDLEDFANGGLRTLCIATRTLTEAEFLEWATAYDQACAATKDREDEIEKACELIERDLTIIGATALEDKLQVGVPEAIEQLHRAGIKLWILTGDKLQTAIEIGFSCNLLQPDMDIMIISADTRHGARSQIEAGLAKVKAAQAPVMMDKADAIARGAFAVVIDGETLRHALDDSLKDLFLDLTTRCYTVVCCRVSPAQKAQTVALVKQGKSAMTLAIGDGANDVAMIQEAHVGIGIAGLEGAQASMSADYAIGQFRFLTKLLLVHGRWCYMRVGDMHANFFYKSVVWTFAMLWYQIFVNFNATYLFDYTFVMLYNLVFSSLPVIAMGAFDQDLPARAALANPSLYKRGIQGLHYTRSKFWIFMLDGIYQSLVVFYVPFFVFNSVTSNSVTGRVVSLSDFGTTVAFCAVTAANLFVGLNTKNWTWIVFACVIGSCLSIWVWVPIYSLLGGTGFTGEAPRLFTTFPFFATLALSQVLAIAPRFIYNYVSTVYSPTDADLIRERVLFSEGGTAEDGRISAPPPNESVSKTRFAPTSSRATEYGVADDLELSPMAALPSSFSSPPSTGPAQTSRYPRESLIPVPTLDYGRRTPDPVELIGQAS